MSLTTPVLDNYDLSTPGENWFLYWKTSSKLWREKISSQAFSHYVFIPIYWGIHSETGQDFDFGTNRPETNIKNLIDICNELGKEPIILFPVSNLPYLINGGIPPLLARCLSISESGINHSVFNSSGNIFKLYSFFDPRIYQCYNLFTERFQQYLSSEGVCAPIFALDGGCYEDGKFKNFFIDRSSIFDQAFSRYLKSLDRDKIDLAGPREEQLLMDQYQEEIRKVYLNAARENLKDYWEGEMKWSFLGSSEKSFFEFLAQGPSEKQLSSNLFSGLKEGVFTSSILLGQEHKGTVLNWQLQDIVRDMMVPSHINPEKLGHNLGQSRALSFFTLFEDEGSSEWEDLGLKVFLNEFFESAYEMQKELVFNGEDSEEYLNSKFFFVPGNIVQDKSLNKVLKAFMSGAQIILTKNGLGEEENRRLESFILENSLEVQEIKQDFLIRYIELGDGRLFIFDCKDFMESNIDKKFKFWSRFIKTLEIKHIYLEADKDLNFLWQSKSVHGSDFNYDEVRRLKIYNSSSYKKSFKIKVPANFALIKFIDSVNSELSSKENEIDLLLHPKSKIGLDFGVFE